jgi:hypothetical protein
MITVVKPLLNLHRAGRIRARIVLESQAGRGDIEWAEAIVFCRNTEPRLAPLLAAVRSRGTPLIYDLDDNLFELPPNCGDTSRVREASRQAMLEEYLRSAALVRVYAPPLAQRVAALNPRVAQIFAPVDLSLVPPPRETRPPGPVKIVYATSRTQDALCDIFQPALAQVASRYGDRIEIHFWGCRRPASVAGRNVHCHGLIYQYDRYLRCFSRGGYDIGLAPLPDDAFYRSKTNNKFREYGASGIAGIYSNNEVYSHCVEHEVSGLLVANTTEGWLRALGRLIEDGPLRTRIQRQAREYVREHYAQEKFEQLFLEQLQGVLNVPTGPARAFSPQPTMQAGCAGRAESAGPAIGQTAVPGLFRRFFAQTRRSLGTLQRLGPRRAWTALSWFASDRCFAAWLSWQLSDSGTRRLRQPQSHTR